MNPKPQKAEELFDRALQFEPDERAAFLAGACGNDVHLRRRVEDLLMASEAQTGFLAEDQPTESSATLLDESELTEGSGSQIGRYKLLEKLGEGGFGSVWAAEQKEPVRRRVALKIIKLGMDTKQVVARFEAERQALALMDHPNIAKVLDAGATDTGRPYFVMELVKGVAITKYCNHDKLSTKNRLGLFIKVCQAIQHAHQKGIIHRDIKPSNVMVTLHDGVPVPKVIDFGIAKATQQELTEKTIYTQYSQFIGTPAYMSPEQAEMSGLDIDTRSDIYSLGVLLYELLTGTTPFDTKELMQSGLDEMRKIIREREPVRPSTRLSQTLVADDPAQRETLTPNEPKDKTSSSRRAGLLPQIPSDLDWIAMKCLEKDRSRRYDTANGLALDLKRHLEDDPIIARPPSTSYRMRKAWRRNKVVYSAGVAVATALIIGLSVSHWQTLAARKAQLDAEAARIGAVAAQQEADAHARKAIESQRRSQRLLYVSDMALAGQALTQNRTGRTIELLEKHRPQADQEDFRGWEWRYLWQETRSDEISTIVMHDRPLRSVTFSHDGSRLASFAAGKELNIQDMAGIRPAINLKTDLFLLSTAFSRSGDMLAFAGSGKVRVIHVDTGEEVDSFDAPIRYHYGSDRLLAFVTDDSLLYVALRSGELLVRDVSNQRDLGMIQVHKGAMSSLVLSRDRTLMVTGGVDGMVHLYEIDDPARPVYRLTLDATGCQRVLDCAISNDKRYVAVCGLESVQVGGYLRLFDLQNSTYKDLAPVNKWVGAVEFSHDGRHLVSAGAEQIIQFWDLDSARMEAFYRGHQDEIWSLSISGKDGTIATAGKDLAVKLWAGLPSKQASSVSEIANETGQIQMSADGSHIATLSRDGTITIMDTSSFSVITTLKNFAELRTLDPVNPFVVARKENSDLLSLIDYQNDSVVKEFEDVTVAISTDGTHMAHRISSNKVSILGVPDLEEVGRYDVTFPEGRDLAGMSFSASGRYLLARTWAMEFGVLDLISGTWRIYQTDHKQAISGAIFSPDERYVVTTSGGGRVKVIELNSGAIESYNPDLMAAPSAAFSPDGRILVVITGARRIWMMDWNTRQEMLVIPGMGGSGSRLYFSQDGSSMIVYESRNSDVSVLRAPSWEEIEETENRKKRRISPR